MAQRIKAVTFKNSGKILIELNRSAASRNSEGVVNKNEKVLSDLQPHGDLLRAAEKMMPHILIAMEFAKPTYDVINKDFPIDKKWFDNFDFADDPRFEGITLTGVIVVGKEAADGIYLLGTKETANGGISKLKTPLISLLKDADGYNYPLQNILDAQFETFVTEVLEYQNELKFAPDPQGKLWEEATSMRKVS